jgi:hypothetical protein
LSFSFFPVVDEGRTRYYYLIPFIAVFPGLIEAIDANDIANARKWVLVIETVLQKAEVSLRLE